MAVGRALPSAWHGDFRALCEYAARCDEIHRIYRQHVRAYYAGERRWPESGFWQAAGTSFEHYN
jgi:hypothetical protein